MLSVTRFITANKRLSQTAEARLPAAFTRHIQTIYKYKVAGLLNRRPGQVVLDVGGGKECPFLPFLQAPATHLIIALDLSEEELRRNPRLGEKVVADATARGFPLRDGATDLVVSRAVLEHIRDSTAFFENCARVLRPGGVMVHAFSGRFAPFALMNRAVPNWLTRRLIGYLHPEWREEANYGFLAFYHRCYFSAIKELLDRFGFENIRFDLLYYQSTYFDFFFPLFILMVLYDWTASALGIRNLASGIVVTAERPSDSGPARPCPRPASFSDLQAQFRDLPPAPC
jgi:SAM-dependent methyltransferase